MSPDQDLLIGIDLGGTNVRVGALSKQGKLLVSNEMLIEAERGPEAGLERIIGLIETTLKKLQAPNLIAIGIGAAGPVDRALGAILNPFTLPTWENVSIVPRISQHFGVPVAFENDADVAILGEYWRGAGQGASPLTMFTLGTGVGLATMIDGKLYRGAVGFHPEGGHSIIDPTGPQCYCGANGCMEMFIAGPAVARRAREMASNSPTRLLEMAGADPAKITAAMVSQAAVEGDEVARGVMAQTGYYLGLSIINVIRFFYPEKILLGGSGVKNFSFIEPTMRTTIDRQVIMEPDRPIPIELAQLGGQAGMIGAAYAALISLE